MKKILSVVLTLAIIATALLSLGISASASEEARVLRLTQTATNIKLEKNMTFEEAKQFVNDNIPGFSNMGCFVYADLGNGQYKCIRDGQFGITDETGTLAEIFSYNTMSVITFNGTMTDKYVGVSSTSETIKPLGETYTDASNHNFGTVTPFEIPNIANWLTTFYSEADHIAVYFKLKIETSEQKDWILSFKKENQTDKFEQSQDYAPETDSAWTNRINDYDEIGTEWTIVTFAPKKYEALDVPTAKINLSKAGITASFRSKAEMADFAAVMVDDVVIDAANYTVTSGSTIVTLSNSYLKTLADGDHNITIYSVDGSCNASFAVANSNAATTTDDNNTDSTNASTSPKTGDYNLVMLYTLIAALAFGGIVTATRKKEN